MNPSLGMALSLFLASAAWAGPSPLSSLKALRDIDSAAVAGPHRRELLILWASWCPECRDKLTNVLPKSEFPTDLKVIAVGTEKDESRARSFIEEQKVRFAVYMDSEKSLRKELKIFGVPGWALYERDGDGWKLIQSKAAWKQEEVESALGFKLGTKG